MLLSFMFKPSIFGSSLIRIDRISAPIKNRYGAKGSPCLHSLSVGIFSDRKPGNFRQETFHLGQI